MNNLLISSDPHLSNLRHKIVRKQKTLSEEAKALLIVRETFDTDDDQENLAFCTEDPLLHHIYESDYSE